jgi:sortase (surface protein transpeptidase)
VPAPVSLVIPAIGVRTRLVGIGTSSRGVLKPPRSAAVAGWYTLSARPGTIGPSVIAGHYDSRTGPGVFFRLRLLHPGDRVYIRRADGELAVFAITAVRTYRESAFPAVAVYGPAPYPALRLITCGGPYAAAIGGYLDNVIAFGYQIAPQGSS